MVRQFSDISSGRQIRSGSVLVSTLASIVLAATLPAYAADANVQDKKQSALHEVTRFKDLPYHGGPDAHPIKHKLDVYVPKGEKNFPVIFFVHGGAWRHGDKSFMGVYSGMGMFWARHGFGAVVINYRLSPSVVHPEHIKDVARAFAWTYRNIEKYGGRKDWIFASGHSAGAHLVALLSTDERYLKSEGLSLHDIRGCIPISGVYRIPENNRFFDGIFGTSSEAHQDAAPIYHAGPDAPPFLIIYADQDLLYCNKEQAEGFCKTLQSKKCSAVTMEVKDRNHATVLLSAMTENDPVEKALFEFVARHTRQ